MKNVLVVLTMIIAGCTIAGQEEVDTWNGATVDDLYLTYGAPTKSVKLSDGKRVIEFYHSRDSDEYYCTLRYVVDLQGVVVSGKAEGNIGGCNRLIKENPKRNQPED